MNHLIGVLIALVVSAPALAQQAPEGNAHPRSGLVSASQGVSAPLGPPIRDPAKAPTPDEQWAFASRVEVEPLLDLAVFHRGRVKIMDSLARETVRAVVGRASYREDTLDAGSGKVVSRSFDPLFTLIDFVVDPAYYTDKPVIAAEFLPLREELLRAAFPDDKPKRERWMKLGRITPAMLDQHGRAIAERFMDQDSYRRGLMSLDTAYEMFDRSWANLLVVAPASKDQPWIHLSQLPDDHPARVAALALGERWRARDADGVNAQARALREALLAVSPDVYPTSRRSLEAFYNRARAFEWGMWLYAFAVVSLLLAFGTGRAWLAKAGGAFLGGGLLLHAVGFAARCVIAERFAIQNQFESMTGVSLFAVVVGSVIMLVRRQWLFGAAAAGVGFLILITATQTGIPGREIEREAAILNTSVLLKYHVTTVLSSYGLIALGFLLSLFYLGANYLGRRDSVGGGGVALAMGGRAPGTRAKLLADLDASQMIVLQLAFWTLGVGILLGAWWADHSWGRWWAFDSKETWALITWIVYLIVIHVRVARPAGKGLTTAWLSVVGFFVMLWTYFGVNLLLPGLHAYA